MALAPGTHLGRYQIRSLLGVGGMGEVYLAQDTTLRRPVALKLLPADLITNTDRLHRFEREAHAASSLNHPNILTIHEIGAENQHHFISTEFIDGDSLRQRIGRAALGLNEALDIGIQVASALAAAHAAGIVHRDIKPENIMLRRDGFVKVLDFGLAKLIEQEPSKIDRDAPTKASVHTEPGVVMGTITYMSPEQARGLEVDGRTDIWSLGCVLYEMVTTHTPFEGATTSDVIGFILLKDPPPLSFFALEVPAELERILLKSLHKDKEQRYQEVSHLGADLKSLKQRLEFEAELERAGGITERISEPQLKAASGSAVTETIEAAPEEQTTEASDLRRPTIMSPTAASLHGISPVSAPVIANYPQHKSRTAFVLAALLLLIVAGLAYFLYFARSSTAAIDSVAVLPFANTAGDPNIEYLSDGISESLINSLSQLPQLKVIARSSTFKYKGKEIDPHEVANALGVQAIVTGRVVQRGDNLQISVEMVDARDKTQMWGAQFNRQAGDLQAVQEEMARTISEKLRLRLTGAQAQQLTKRATPNAEAYQLYLNAVFYYRKGSIENLRRALDYHNQAIALDPNFALAYTGVATVYNGLGGYSVLDPKEAQAKAKAAAQKALELDEMLAEAHNVLAIIKRNEWDWAGAESEYKRAIELNPNLTNAHSTYALYLSYMGRHTEALSEIKRAQELDPLRISFKNIEGGILQSARRYDEAIQQLQNVIKLQPDYSEAYIFLGYTYAAKGMYAEAIAAYQKYISIDGETTTTQAYLGYAYAMLGKRGEALAILNKLKTTAEYVSPAELAILYAGLGDKEAALSALKRAYDAHDPQMQYLKVEPHYDSLRSDSRFTDLMHRVGLTP